MALLRRAGIGFWLLLLAARPAIGQWLEKTFYIPDSASGVLYPDLLAYNPANRCVYVGSEDCPGLVVINTETHRSIARVPVGRLSCAPACNPAANEVYCSDATGVFYVIDGATNRIVHQEDIGYAALSLTYCPESGKLLWAEQTLEPGAVIILDAASRQVLKRVFIADAAWCAAYNPATQRLYCSTWWGGDKAVAVIDVAHDSLICHFGFGDTCAVDAICTDAVRNRVYLATDMAAVVVLDGTNDSLLGIIRIADYPLITVMRHDPAMNKLYCGTDEGEIIIIDCDRRQVMTSWCVGCWVTDACLNPDQNKVYCIEETEGLLTIIDGSDNSWIAQFPVGEFPAALCYSPADGQVYCTIEDPCDLVLIDGVRDTIALTIPTGRGIRDLCYNYQNDRLYTANSYATDVCIIEGTTERVRTTLEVDGCSSEGLLYTPISNKIYSIGGNLSIIPGDRDTVSATIHFYRGGPPLCWNEHQNRLYCVIENCIARIDCATDRYLGNIRVGHGSIQSLNYCAEYDRLHCLCHNSSLVVIDAVADTVLRELQAGRDALCHNTVNHRLYMPITSGRYQNILVVSCEGEVLDTIRTEALLGPMCYNPMHNKLYLYYKLGRTSPYEGLMVIDGATNRIITRLALPVPRLLFYNPLSDKLYWVEMNGTITVISGATDQVLKTIATPAHPTAIALDPNRNILYVASFYSCISVLRDEAPSSAITSPTGSTILRKHLALFGTRPATLLDASGRRRMTLSPGMNNISQLPTGVYFIIREQNPTPHKAVILR